MNHLLHTQPTELWVPQAWGGRGNLDMASTLNINWQLSGTTATIFSTVHKWGVPLIIKILNTLNF